MVNETKIKVFQMDDIEWWAGESQEACVAEGKRQCGPDCYDEPDEYRELTEADMQHLQFVDEDGSKRSFAEELARMVATGSEFPCPFAATDW